MSSNALSRRALLTAAISPCFADLLSAQSNTSRPAAFPDRPLRIIVPATPGGVQDVQTRRVAPKLSDEWGQQVLVDNRPGASGNIALDATLRAPPDGYTMVMAPASITTLPHLMKVPYDPLKDFAAVTKFTAGPVILAAHPAQAFRSIAQLLEHARREPGRLSVAGFGVGSIPHLSLLLFNKITGAGLVHIPYAGGAQQVADALSGQVPMLLDFAAVLLPHLKAGRLKALSITGAKRLDVLPDVPTFEEQGIQGMRITAWQGILVPTATPDEVVRKLNAGFVKALADPELRATYLAEGAEIGGDSPDEFSAFIRAEHARWGQVIREAGVRLE